jgi:hypothetical protein
MSDISSKKKNERFIFQKEDVRAGVVAKVVQYLPVKHKSLSSNPTTANKLID